MLTEKELAEWENNVCNKEIIVLGAVAALLRSYMTEEGIVDSCHKTTGIDRDFIQDLMGDGSENFYKNFPPTP